MTNQGSAAIEPTRRARRKPGELQLAIAGAAKRSFEKNGYRHTTTREIAEAGSFAEVLIFRHFGTKAQLFEASVVEPFAKELLALAESYDAERPSREFFARLFEFFRASRPAIMSMMSAGDYDTEVDVKALGKPGIITPLFASLEAVTLKDASRHGMTGVDVRMTTAISMATLLGMVVFDEWIFGKRLDELDFMSIVDATWRHLSFGSSSAK